LHAGRVGGARTCVRLLGACWPRQYRPSDPPLLVGWCNVVRWYKRQSVRHVSPPARPRPPPARPGAPMLTRLAKRFDFDAAHWLPFVGEAHKCYRMHGHTYRVQLVLQGEPDRRGMLMDFADIERAWVPVHGIVDHRV